MNTKIADFLHKNSFHRLIVASKYQALNVSTADKLQCFVCAHVIHLHGPCYAGCLHADRVLYRCEECCEVMDRFGSTPAGTSIFYENHINGQYASAIMVPSSCCDICAPMHALHACNMHTCTLCMQHAARPRTAYQTQTDCERWRLIFNTPLLDPEICPSTVLSKPQIHLNHTSSTHTTANLTSTRR